MKPTKIVDTIITMYPELEKDKKKIMRHIYKNQNINNNLDQEIPHSNDEIIFEKFNYNNIDYYRDTDGSILDIDINIVGIYDDSDINNIKYYFFNEVKEIIKKIKK